MTVFKRSPYMLEPRSPMARLALSCMILSILVRVVYFSRVPMPTGYVLIHLGLPVVSAVLFWTVVEFFGREYLALTSLSVLVGVVFFVFRIFSLGLPMLHICLCLCLYTLVLVLFVLTVFGVIPTKRLLYPLFGLPLLYHICIEDMKLYVLAQPPVPFVEWLPEISVLLIMAALLCLSFAMKKKPV